MKKVILNSEEREYQDFYQKSNMKKTINAWIMVDLNKSTRPGTIRYDKPSKEDIEYALDCRYEYYPCKINYVVPEKKDETKKNRRV